MSAAGAHSAKKSADRLGTENVGRLVAGFALTALAGLLLNSVYSLTDALFVAWGVGDTAMGGVSAVYPFVILQGAISTAIGGGAASIVSRRLGGGDNKGAARATLSAMTAFYLTAAAVTAVGFAAMPSLLAGMGATGDLAPHAKTYFTIILAGNVFSTGFSSIIRAEGKNVYSLLIWVIPVTLNIVLDAVFILALGWGVAGSAAATVMSQFVSFAMSVLFFTRFSSLSFSGVRPSVRDIGAIFAIGVPSLIQMGTLSLISLIINSVLSKIDGETGVTAFGYMNRIITLAVVPFTAAAQALAPVVGYNYGAGKGGRARTAARLCLLIALSCAAAAFVIGESIPGLLMRIFTSDARLVAYGARGMRIAAPALLFMPVPLIAGAALQATGRKILSAAFFAVNFLLFLPLSFGLSSALGTDGLWTAYALSAAAAAAAVGVSLLLPSVRARCSLSLCAPPYLRRPHSV